MSAGERGENPGCGTCSGHYLRSMTSWQRTYRMVGDERVEGTWRHVVIHNMQYFLTDLKVYADGLVDCWGLVTLDEFRQKVASGWVTTSVPEGQTLSVHHLAAWTVGETTWQLEAEDLVAEVADEIDRLAGRPDAAERCQSAIAEYLASPDEAHRASLREAYAAIPRHLRRYVLGDQDRKDRPLRVLMTPIDQMIDGRLVEPKDHEEAVQYFRERQSETEKSEERLKQRDAQRPRSVIINQVFHRGPWPLGLDALRAEFPRPLRHGRFEYPSVHHAFWAAALANPAKRDGLSQAPTAVAVEQRAREAGLRDGWEASRLAIMLDLLRARFQANADLAQILVGTGDAR